MAGIIEPTAKEPVKPRISLPLKPFSADNSRDHSVQKLESSDPNSRLPLGRHVSSPAYGTITIVLLCIIFHSRFLRLYTCYG